MMDVTVESIDSYALEEAIAERIAAAVGGKVQLSRHGHIDRMLKNIPRNQPAIEALQSAIVPLIDLLLDDIALETTEQWPSRSVDSVLPDIDENPDSITIVLRDRHTGEALASLEPIPLRQFVKAHTD